MVGPAGAVRAVDSDVDEAATGGGYPPSPLIVGSAIFSLSRQIARKTYNVVGKSRSPSGLVLLGTTLRFAAFTGILDDRQRLVNAILKVHRLL